MAQRGLHRDIFSDVLRNYRVFFSCRGSSEQNLFFGKAQRLLKASEKFLDHSPFERYPSCLPQFCLSLSEEVVGVPLEGHSGLE